MITGEELPGYSQTHIADKEVAAMIITYCELRVNLGVSRNGLCQLFSSVGQFLFHAFLLGAENEGIGSLYTGEADHCL